MKIPQPPGSGSQRSTLSPEYRARTPKWGKQGTHHQDAKHWNVPKKAPKPLEDPAPKRPTKIHLALDATGNDKTLLKTMCNVSVSDLETRSVTWSEKDFHEAGKQACKRCAAAILKNPPRCSSCGDPYPRSELVLCKYCKGLLCQRKQKLCKVPNHVVVCPENHG
jgi:hypothetical protein